MKSPYCLIFTILLIVTPFITRGQSAFYQLEDMQVNPFSQITQKKKATHKALGDTLFYEDFANRIPLGWTVVDATNKGHNWIWSNSAPGGQYSTNIGTLNSITASNGYLCLPSDFYNTPFPAPGADIMDAYVQSPAITIIPRAAVDISWTQALRYCCSIQNDLVLEVSTDSINWTTYDSNKGRGASTYGGNGERMNINVSNALSNSSRFWVRFRSTGNSHYFWMVDDLTITEGLTNALSLDSALIDYFPGHKYKPQYTSLPPGLFCNPQITAKVFNIGVFDQTGVDLNLNLHSRPTSQSNFSIIHSQQINLPTVTSGNVVFALDSINVNFPASLGDFYFSYGLSADSILQNQQIALDTSPVLNMVNYDTVVARDQNNFNLKASATYYVRGQGDDGEGWAEYFELGNPDSSKAFFASSISVFIANDTNNIGASIKPYLWEVEADTLKQPAIATNSLASTTITSSMLGTWVSLPFFPPPPFLYGSSPYAAGIVQTSGQALGKYFVLGRDASVEEYSPRQTNFVGFKSFTNNSTEWYHTPIFAGIRINGEAWHVYSPCNMILSNTKNVKQGSLGVIYPNPTSGQVNFAREIAPQELEVRDINGRLVFSRSLQEDQSSIDLSALQNGLYFLHFKGEEERVEKVLLQK